MLTIERDIQRLVEREATLLNEKHPESKRQVDALVAEFAARFRDNLESYADVLGGLCRSVDRMLDEHQITDPLRRYIDIARKRILTDIIIQFGMQNRSLLGSMPLNLEPQFPHTGGTRNGNGRQRGSHERTDQEYEEIVRRQNYDLVRLAAGLGVDAAADALCALGQIGDEERARVISFISAYLGRCAKPQSVDIGTLLNYPKAILEIPSIRSVVRRLLLQDVYQFLLEQGSDDPQQYKRIRRQAPALSLQKMRALARSTNVTDPAIHASLFVEISELIQRACSQPHPQNLVQSVQEQGRDCPFPSLRQLIAIQLLRERRFLYVGFEPGKGKTPIPLYLAEQLREQGGRPRILYLAPKPVVQELPNRIRPGSAPQPTRDCYYVDTAQAPSVGVIASELKNAEIEEIASREDIVFVPYTMIHSTRKVRRVGSVEDVEEELSEDEIEVQVFELMSVLCAQRWDILVLDEAHCIDGNKRWTRLVDRLIHGEDGRGTHLSRNGYVVAMSGSPIMNTIADPVVIHDLMQPPAARELRYGLDVRRTNGRDTSTERGLDPIRVRQALNETLLLLDPPEDWMEHVRKEIDYELSDEEMEFVQAICTNPTLTAGNKIDACMQFILCPQLVSGNNQMPESLLEWVKLQLHSDLSEKDSILIAENMRAVGVLRAATGDNAPGPNEMELHFYERINRICQEWEAQQGVPVHFYTVHGDTPPHERQRAYADLADAKKNRQHKVVVFAITQCLNVGIRLGLDRIITAEWPYNTPEIQQLLKRALREGNDDVYLTPCYARDTIQHGIYEQSIDKYNDALQCLYGTGVADAILRNHIRERSDQEQAPGSETELFRLLLRTSPAQRRYELERWLHGRGMNGVIQFWERHQETFENLYDEADRLGTGDMQRFLGTLTSNLMDRCHTEIPHILDIQSGGMTLERELRRLGRDTDALVMHIDPIPWMLERGLATLHRDNPERRSVPAYFQTNPADIQRLVFHRQLDGVPFDISVIRNLDQFNHIQSDITVHERARALLGAVSALRPEGHLVVPLSRTACTIEEFDHFVQETLPLFGCLAMPGWQGAVRSQDNENDEPFRAFCVVAQKFEEISEDTLRERLRVANLRFTQHAGWATTAEGTRVMNAIRRPKLPYPLRHTVFRMGNRDFVSADARPDVRQAQVQHLHTLENAVQEIRSLAPNKKAWNALAASDRRSLERHGILYAAPLSKTLKKPTFWMRQYPGNLFFPFDPQWS